jgi:nucleoside-diphosphate-sugar epimerase
MRVVVIGGRGLIGSKVTTKLSAEGHEVITASRRSGVDSLTGEGTSTPPTFKISSTVVRPSTNVAATRRLLMPRA